MKTVELSLMKRVRKACLMLAVILGCMPMFTSCDTEETTHAYYSVDFVTAVVPNQYVTSDVAKEILDAILEYQRSAGIIDRQFEVTYGKVDMTEDDYVQMHTDAMIRAVDMLDSVNYRQMLTERGINIPADLEMEIQYNLNYETMNGDVMTVFDLPAFKVL